MSSSAQENNVDQLRVPTDSTLGMGEMTERVIIGKAIVPAASAEADATDDASVVFADTAGVRRVNVKFAPSAYETLERLARRRGKTMSDVLRDAIQLESWLANSEDEGWHVLLERKGRVRELVRP